MPGCVFRLFFHLLNSWRAMVAFREVFSNLCFNSCIEARFVALAQLNLSRLSDIYQDNSFSYSSTWSGCLLEADWRSQFHDLTLIAVAVPVCSRQPKRLGRDLNFHSQQFNSIFQFSQTFLTDKKICLLLLCRVFEESSALFSVSTVTFLGILQWPRTSKNSKSHISNFVLF